MLVFRARRALAEKLQSSDDVRSRALGVSSILSMLKSLLGGAALKSAVTAIAVTATAIAVATAPGDQGKATSPTKVAPGTAGHSTAPVAPQSAPDRASARGLPRVAAPPKSGTSDPVQAPPVPPASDVGGNADPPATPPPSAAPPAAARPPAPPPAAVATPSASVPAVTVPGIPISTPAVTVPSISLPDIPALDPPNLPGTLPDLHVP